MAAPTATSADVGLTAADVPAIVSAMLSNSMPLAEAGAAAPGSSQVPPKQDHVHPRLTATFTGTLAADGTATVTFTRTFTGQPAISPIAIENNNNPTTRFKVKSWAQDGNGAYTGCVLYGDRSRALPTVAPLNGSVILLLSSLITSLNSIFTQLSGYAAYEPAAGASFVGFAIQPSS